MNRPVWTNEVTRRARVGQSARYIAYVMDLPGADVARIVRPLNQRGRLYARHSKPGRGK